MQLDLTGIHQLAAGQGIDAETVDAALAEALRIGRTTLYRAMDKLVSDGKIERCGRAFRLTKGENE